MYKRKVKLIFLYEVFQDLQIKGTKSNHGIVINYYYY